MHRLIEEKIAPRLNNPMLLQFDDSAELNIEGQRLAFTTDSYVVKPVFFPGGNIGKLAVCGTVNDLAMKGAIPLYISLSLIIEEGFKISDLEIILETIAETAKTAGVEIVTGDTKVVEKGSADGIFINTAGIGVIPAGRDVSGSKALPGDAVIITGTIGDHGIAVLNERENLGLSIPVESDVSPLNNLVETLFASVPAESVHVLRDPTRGGVATTLNEIANQSKVIIRIEEEKLPVKEEVRGACEILGFDPLYVANEGKFIAIIDGSFAEKALEVLKNHPSGKDAEIIGYVEPANPNPAVFIKTSLGSSRFLSMLSGEQLPRIC